MKRDDLAIEYREDKFAILTHRLETFLKRGQKTLVYFPIPHLDKEPGYTGEHRKDSGIVAKGFPPSIEKKEVTAGWQPMKGRNADGD